MGANSKKQQAIKAFHNKQWPLAKSLLEKAGKSKPDDPDIWLMLGVICGQSGNYQEAEQFLRKTIKLAPESFGAWSNLGNVLMYLGNHADAENSYKQALKYNPANFSTYNNLGKLMRITSRLPEAQEFLNSALRINPSSPEAHYNLGLVFRKLNKPEEAIKHFERVIELRSNFIDAYHYLGDTLLLIGDMDGALAQFLKALSLNPDISKIHVSVASLYKEFSLFDKALSHYETAFRLDQDNAQALVGLALLKADTGSFEEALTLLRDGSRRLPDNLDIAIGICNLLVLKREYKEAYHHIEAFMMNAETDSNIVLAYASLTPQVGDTKKAIYLLETVRKGNVLSAPMRENIEYQLGRLYEDEHDYDNAFHHYAEVKNIRPVPSDLGKRLANMKEIKKAFSREFLSSAPRSTIKDNRPVFILGMPRSGTSLVEQILASHPDVFGGGERTFLWKIKKSLPGGAYPELISALTQEQINECAQRYLDQISALSNSAVRITDKLPHNYLHIGLIDIFFPDARIIHCVRDPADTCTSIFTRIFNLNHRYARNLADLGAYYREYEKLMNYWKRVIKVPLLEVKYEDLVSDFDHKAHALVEFCDLPWDPACNEFYNSKRIVNTPSFDQVSRPIYSSSIGRWKHFESHLQPLIKALNKSE